MPFPLTSEPSLMSICNSLPSHISHHLFLTLAQSDREMGSQQGHKVAILVLV